MFFHGWKYYKEKLHTLAPLFHLFITYSGFEYECTWLITPRVSFSTSFDSKQSKLEPKIVSALSEAKHLFWLFCFYFETTSYGVTVQSKQPETTGQNSHSAAYAPVTVCPTEACAASGRTVYSILQQPVLPLDVLSAIFYSSLCCLWTYYLQYSTAACAALGRDCTPAACAAVGWAWGSAYWCWIGTCMFVILTAQKPQFLGLRKNAGILVQLSL
jgi:hypothetical protein